MRHLGKTVLNGLLMGAAAGALTMGFATKSHAGAVAYSALQITNFQILAPDGSPLAGGAFDVLDVSNFTAAGARQNGAGPTADAFNVPPSTDTDVPMQCVGAACVGIAENDFSRQGGPIAQFSRADAQLFGNSLGAGLTASSVAEVQLNVPSDGSADSNAGTTSSFSFTPGQEGALRIRFDATPELLALLEDPLVSSNALLGWHIAITDQDSNPYFRFAPDGATTGLFCNSPDGPDAGTDNTAENASCAEISDPFALNNSIGVNAVGDIAYDPGTGTFEVVTGAFQADETLQFTIFHETTAGAVLAAVPAPEPAAAGLLGFGLLGLAGLRRRWARG